jgi:protoporphyrinogen oxidase
MLPYNRKIWSCPLEEVSMDLVSQKIEPEPAWSVLRQSLFGGGVGRAYQARFVYPRGGAGELPKAVAQGLGARLRVGAAVTRLERKAGGGWTVRCADGSVTQAEQVVSTIPIPELLDALGDSELAPLRGSFRGNDTLFVVVGLKPGRRFSRFDACQWVFFAGSEAFYRLTMMHAFWEERPAALVAEITAREGQDHAALVTRALADLREAGILGSEDDVAAAFPHLERSTYPIPTLGMPAARETLEAKLAPAGLHLLGRMGRWEYVNTDGVFLGVDAFLAGRGAALAGARR